MHTGTHESTQLWDSYNHYENRDPPKSRPSSRHKNRRRYYRKGCLDLENPTHFIQRNGGHTVVMVAPPPLPTKRNYTTFPGPRQVQLDVPLFGLSLLESSRKRNKQESDARVSEIVSDIRNCDGGGGDSGQLFAGAVAAHQWNLCMRATFFFSLNVV
ncbi:hypothetical protein DAPPUDRAFT_251850 [Daphnia pulex]|uniref:Uncharacterized protein n=1 Tax=Daphnia pulex TaxID=6669 RepID=E9H1H6_DAPPU|nr:hypothetical protein DAPPUDRAFT_251850 [Daphnia pulex]|eukprot:EFX74353.1 hypothetical protein DAPPUDRAFT_251850 [Daphnia pulex]